MSNSKVFVLVVLSLALSFAFAILACKIGLLFSGLDFFFSVLLATAFCIVATAVTVFLFKRQKKLFSWSWLGAEVVFLSLAGIAFLSWYLTRDQMKLFVDPKMRGVHVVNGRNILFNNYVHFSASPDVIAAMIRSKGLVWIPDTPPEKSEFGGYSELERTREEWGWWCPTKMSQPKFYYRLHETTAQGWIEGWWVNGETNEVYALISG